MAFKKMKWIDVPDPNNMPTIDDIPDRPEYQEVVPAFDADNMNRIEEGVEEAHKVLDSIPDVLPTNKGGTGARTAKEALQNLGATRIQTRTYIGTDIYENDKFTANSVTLTFDFVPKIIFVEPPSGRSSSMAIMINGVSGAVLFPSIETSSRYLGHISITWNDKSVTFRSTDEDSYINESGDEYYCVALG